VSDVDDKIGLAVIGCGTIGRVRAELAREHPSIGWLGLCDRDTDVMAKLAADTKADRTDADFRSLVARPEVDAVVVATDENWHVQPILASVEHGHRLFIEKPLAADPIESATVLAAIEDRGIDAVVGYTQRFRRRFITARQRIRDGAIGDVTTVVARAFMNRMVPLATLARTDRRATLTPMVVSGTHSLDVCLWMLEGIEGKEPVEVYARSGDRVLGDLGTKDTTLAIFTLADGTLWNLVISWALPIVWPGAVYGLEIGVVGETGVLDIEDTHRDVIVASEHPQGPSYRPKGFEAGQPRHVDFVGSYPPGDYSEYGLWGPMREETDSWYSRLSSGRATQHATAHDGHRNLILTMAIDLSAKTGQPVKLPVDPEELKAGLDL
jgi:myo-inositol 2-dehydrogenase / D-chiro-inositol 1-dehydrogenase